LFSNDSLTAAHKTLRFGTLVKVTNLLNDSLVIVRINDRLPKKSSRIIDLSKAAARKLNFIKRGITQVSVEEVIKH
jgi:rare lipoprotein A